MANTRLYFPAWEALKRQGKIRIKLDDKSKVKRFLRGVSKEKNEDTDKVFNKSISWKVIPECEECRENPNCVVIEIELKEVLKTRMTSLMKLRQRKENEE